MPKESVTITDNRTGQTYELPITEGTIRATDLRQIKVAEDDFGMMTYDPAFMNTAACRSAITYIDGDRGILRYRGYPIEQLAEQASFLEVAYLLGEGELPNREQLAKWEEHDQVSHLRPHQHHQVPRGVSLRRPSDGHAARSGGRALHLLPRRQAHRRPGEPLSPAGPPAGQAADHRGLRLPALARSALRVSPERPGLHRQLRQHDVQHRRAAPAQQGAAARPRDPADPPRRSRAELLHQRRAGGRLLARGSVLRRQRRDRGAVRTAARRAPTRPCSRCWTRSATRRTSRRSSRR